MKCPVCNGGGKLTVHECVQYRIVYHTNYDPCGYCDSAGKVNILKWISYVWHCGFPKKDTL